MRSCFNVPFNGSSGALDEIPPFFSPPPPLLDDSFSHREEAAICDAVQARLRTALPATIAVLIPVSFLFHVWARLARSSVASMARRASPRTLPLRSSRYVCAPKTGPARVDGYRI